MKVGLIFPGMHPYESNEMLLGMATTMGVDSLWLGDHLLSLFHPALFAEMSYGAAATDPDAYFDPFCVSAALGRQTDLPIGIGVTDALRRRAIDVARSALTLQHMCNGGFNIGIGAGEAENLLPFGYAADRPVGRTEEFLRELRHLLDTGRMPEGVGRTGLPLETEHGKPRVWVGGHGPRMLRLTGQYADGWLPAWAMDPQTYGQKRETIKAHAAAAGRPAPESGLIVPLILADSHDQVADAMSREPLGKLVTLFMSAERWQRYGLEHPFGPNATGFDSIPHQLDPDALRALAEKIPIELFDEFFWCGNPEELTARMQLFVEQGCEHAVLTNGTGLAGGAAEFEARVPDFFRLHAMFAAL